MKKKCIQKYNNKPTVTFSKLPKQKESKRIKERNSQFHIIRKFQYVAMLKSLGQINFSSFNKATINLQEYE